MRASSSRHNECIQTKASVVWPRNAEVSFGPCLNIQSLYELLQIATNDDSSQSAGKRNGKKRASSPPSRASRSSKRARVSEHGSAHRGGSGPATPSSEPGDYDWPQHEYPPLLLQNASPKLSISDDTKLVEVMRHVYEIQYTSQKGQLSGAHEGWMIEEANLMEIVADLQTSEEQSIDFGDVDLCQYQKRLVVASPMLKNRTPWLFLLPTQSDVIDLGWFDISSELVQDVMMAAHIMSTFGRAAIQARLKMVVFPSTAQSELPFKLQVETTVSFRTPTIFEPFPRPSKKKSPTMAVEDAQRRLLEHLYPSNARMPDSYPGSTTIPFFYSILRPAPALPSPFIQEAMQPPGLLPTLLPFQRRSVGWLLDREGKAVTPNGTISDKPSSTEFSFWEKIEEGNGTWYLNRLGGLLAPSLPETTPALGGILAEEPGLGKTLESIAMIMMNPAPPERNPSVTRWDPEARLEVKAIKTTLIVTPPALASQWVDELATHAPSLKVMTYDGWSKVPVPITQSQVKAAQFELLKKKGKISSKPKKRKYKYKFFEISDDSDEEADEMDVDLDPEAAAIQDWCAYVNTFDVVVTTYTVLRTDFNVALAAPVRPRREDVVYSTVERTRSPLVMVEWNRVIMDEVQMVGGGKTEDMVSLIPRLSSFAVSGTPARQQVADLIHVLKFLRVDEVVGGPRLWNRLTSSGFGAAHFAALFQTYGIRTLKAHVSEELTIPQQTRYLVSITLGPVEKHVYDQTLEAALQDLGLDARGIAASEGWQIDSTVLRSALRRLRGICTHPQVGQLQRPGDRLFKPGAVKTIDDVLQNMRETNWRTMMDNHKAKIQALVRLAQLQTQDDNDEDRIQHALNTLIEAEREADALVDEAQAALDKYLASKRHSKKAKAITGGMEADSVERQHHSDKSKGKQRQVSEQPDTTSDSESDDENDSSLVGGDERGKKRGALQNRLRECRIALHRAKFLQGDMYHSFGATHSAEEDAAYSAAEGIRRGLLKGTEDDALRAMALLTHDANKKNLTEDALSLPAPFLDDSDLLPILKNYQPSKAELSAKPQPYKVTMFKRVNASLELIEEANNIIVDVLNEQTALLWEWRTYMTAILTQKLASSEDQPDGEEYQRTLDNQGEAETYLVSYTALLSDRRQALVNERTLLAAHDVREKRLRHTKAAMNAASAVKEALLAISDEIELQPEHEVLHTELSQKRKDLLELLNGRAIKSVLVDLTTAATRIKSDVDPEKIALKNAATQLRQMMNEQNAIMDKLDADLVLIRKAFNQRILYFRQLQEISDTVAEVEWDGTLVEALLQATLEKNDLGAEINKSRARHRYLENLAKKKDEGMKDEDDECCILCRCEFLRGFITQCAHVFCEGCMKAWLIRKEGKTCPVCRVPVDPSTIERFTVSTGQPDTEATEQCAANEEVVPKSRRQISYNMIDAKLFEEVNSMESFGDYGSKIQTLVRHLLYLKVTDPGAKSIVFSAWADSLLIMERALVSNGIRCLRIDQKSKGESAAKKFKNDPNILVLLLHGERENAGLNITCASRVFLLESVVHHGFEIQAIARIDRMGQTRPTEVYCYYAEETIERNILDLAARQGLSLYTKENSAGTLNVSSLGEADSKVADSPRKKRQTQKGDFISKMDDMLAILFPHMYEDVEYLISPDDFEMDSLTGSQSQLNSSTLWRSQTEGGSNAAAGPSRSSA